MLSDDLTFEIAADVDGETFEIILTAPIKNMSEDEAARIIRILRPNARIVEVRKVMCQY